MVSGALFSSLSTGWRLVLRILRIFNIWVCPPWGSFVDTAGGKGDLSDNWNAASPSSWKSHQHALTICSVSEMYPMAVMCLFWARDSFRVARGLWLPCHISKMSWTMAILCNVSSCTSVFISEFYSVFVVSNEGSLPVKILLLARANCWIITCLQRVSPVLLTASSR